MRPGAVAFPLKTADVLILLAYVAGLFAIGGLYGGKIRNSSDLFRAGGGSPWWVSGLSGFMTMFSAGTFVVWGGIAFKHGLVAVSINMCYGVAALLVGWTLAGRWKESGIATPAEFIRLRFGKGAVHFYTWTMMSYRLVGTGVSLYALAVLLCALIPVPEGWLLRDAATGNLSLSWAVMIFGAIVVIYTVTGGLWAVLMTDVLQFIVLNVAVAFVVPLVLRDAGGFGAVLANLPEGFLRLTSSEFTWVFLAGWTAIHFFMVGAEWAFVQRYLCVRTAGEARKSAWLFGGLYLISPLFWLLPPLVFRVVRPDANPEQAYILAAWSVLPAGMLGLMVAAMFSATASMVSSQLNVFAGVLTQDIIVPLLRRRPDERALVRIGRSMTLVLGVLITAVAIAVPVLGGAEKVILSITSLIVGPLLLPLVWALFSRKITTADLMMTALVCCGLGLLVRFGLGEGAFVPRLPGLAGFAAFAREQPRSMEALVGVLLPAVLLALAEWRRKQPAAGAAPIAALADRQPKAAIAVTAAELAQPARVVGWSLAACAVALLLVGFSTTGNRGLLFLCALSLAALAAPPLLIRRAR
jgi:solute:Na+ symporter, SSS family